jgi:hypothetical protein
MTSAREAVKRWGELAARALTRLLLHAKARWDVVALCACAAFCFVYVLCRYPGTPVLRHDTLSYLKMVWYRAPGVGLLAAGLHAITGTLFSVVILQLVVGLGASIFFPLALGRAVGSRVLPLLLAPLLVFNGTYRRADLTILSESLCLSLLLFAVGFGIRFLVRGRVWELALASGAVACSMLFRPTAVAGLLPLLVFFLVRRPWSFRTITIGFAPFIAIVAVWSAANYHRFHRATPFLRGGWVLFAATAQYYDRGILELGDPVIERHRRLVEYVVRSNQPLKDRLQAAESEPLGTGEALRQAAMLEIHLAKGELGHIGTWMTQYFNRERARVCGGFKNIHACRDREQGALANVAIRYQRAAYWHRVFTSLAWYAELTHRPDGELDRRYYDFNREGQSDPRKNHRWPGYRGVAKRVSAKAYPTLDKPPLLLHFWQRAMQVRVGPGRGTISSWLGYLNAGLCLAFAGAFVVNFVWRSVRRRRLSVSENTSFVACVALYGVYALHHLLCAAVHPALSRYAGLMQPFVLGALFIIVTSTAKWIMRIGRPRSSSAA